MSTRTLRRLLLAAVSVALLTSAGLASATLLPTFSLAELDRAAHMIVRGEVVDQETVWDPLRRELYTHSFVRVDEVLAGGGTPGDWIVVRQIGGVLDGIARGVVGTAELRVGDELILFTRTDGALHYLVGMAQGAYHIASAVGRGPPIATSLLTRTTPLALLAPPGPTRAPAPDTLTLGALHTELARLHAESSR